MKKSNSIILKTKIIFMKRILLVLFLLPFLSFAQVDLVKWDAVNNVSYIPTYISSNVTSENISVNTSKGVSLRYLSYGAVDTFFQTEGWPNPAQMGGQYDPEKYIQFTIKPNAGYKTDLSSFVFRCRSGSGKFRVKYSKDATFTTGVRDLITETVTPGSWTSYTGTFSPEINPVLDNQTVYVRVYSYSTYNTFEVQTGTNAANIVPLIKGAVSNFDSTKILAINDYVDTKKDVAININPLNNDVSKANVTTLVISNPPLAAEGTAIVNPDNTITFNPASGFIGTSVFGYTISNANETSTATIKVTVVDNGNANLSLWNGAGSSFNPVTNENVNSNAPITSTGASLSYIYENTTSAFFESGNWPTPQQNGGSLDLNKYVEFKISSDGQHELNLKQFNFVYRCRVSGRFQVRYSKDPSFTTGVKVLIPNTNTPTSWTTSTNNFDSDINPVLPTETVYIRVYAYNTNNSFLILNGNGNSIGPVITGTVKNVSNLTANNDYISTPVNRAIVVPILSNDIIGGSPLQAITVTQPVNGTVTVNDLNNVTFTPTVGFTGSTSFTYTLRNSAYNYSSATVYVNGTAAVCEPSAIIPGNNFWKGYVYTYTGNTPAATTYVGTIAENSNFDRDIAGGAMTGNQSVEANNFCGTVPSDKFFVRYLMNLTITEAGNYSITVGGDDGYRLYIDDVPVVGINNWGTHGYTTSVVKHPLSVGEHKFRLEYFENESLARISFSYGLPKGDPSLPFGDNVWNVYGFTKANLDFTNTELRDSYAGYYIDPSVSFDSQKFWNKEQSPSVDNTAWNGAPIQIDNFTLTYKRKGFPCGRYQIQLVNCDDVAQVYIDGTPVFSQTYTVNGGLINGGTFYTLNKNSEVEIRLREDGGNANVAFNFIEVPFVYNGSVAPPIGSSIKVEDDSILANNLEVCSCYIASGKTLTVPENVTLTVKEKINVAAGGKLVVKNNGSLLQEKNGVFTGNNDSFVMERSSTPMKNFDFSYWSSPVVNQNLFDLSPNTLHDKYMSYTGTGWKSENAKTTSMVAGKGYIIRVPKPNSTYTNEKDSWTGPSYVQNLEFVGIPNNGDITGETVTAGNFYLIGNPYPSAIDADEFLFGDENKDILKGTIYFWTHNTSIKKDGSAYKYASADYASYNRTGGVGTAPNVQVPLGKIAAGQSFFGTAKSPGTIKFNNEMRVAGENSQFFKPAKTNKNAKTEKNRLWLTMTNPEGAYKQALIGYVTGATNEVDVDFDGLTFNGNSFIDFYSLSNTSKLAIQGRALPFEDTDKVPMGFRSTVDGDFTISIEKSDGLLANQKVYLEDAETNIIHDLTASDYTFTTIKGTYDNRFVVKYSNRTLGTGDFETVNDAVAVAVQNKVINITSIQENIDKVYIYDLLGKQLYLKDNIGNTQLTIDNMTITQQILIVKAILENGNSATKKIIFR